MAENNIFFEIGNLVTGADRDLAGYTDYKKYRNTQNLETDFKDFTGAGAPHNPKDRPTRLGKPGGQFDSTLCLIDERGENRYVFVLEPTSSAKFDGNPAIVEIPVVWEGRPLSLLRDVQLDVIDGRQAASFIFDRRSLPQNLIDAVQKSGHGTALKIPFYFNFLDTNTGFQPWIIDDHRYEQPVGRSHFEHDHDHGHDHEDIDLGSAKVENHGGIHPPGISDAGSSFLNHGGIHPPGRSFYWTHGGIHPPGVTSFLIVELP